MNENGLNYLMNRLFWLNSKVDINEQRKICEWYSTLTLEQRRMIDVLKLEAATETEFFEQGD